ncbi:MAG TPA: metallophosphoesterase, partial [Candidatus Sphingobacterium stercorigallinarum]|nr:metallophosphoesterase [Candidatus Sphingobacterium stercorigallinarum]
MVKLNAILLFLLDIYIFFALRATNIRFVKTKWFAVLWWGYSISLLIGLYVSFEYSIPLIVRSIILVAFFLTAVSKFIYAVILLIDDLRRGGVWISRL